MNLDGLCFWHFFPGMFHDFGDSLKCFLGVRDDSWTSSGHFFFCGVGQGLSPSWRPGKFEDVHYKKTWYTVDLAPPPI